MWWSVLGVVAEDRDRLAQRGPDVVEVHARGHDAHDDLERAGLGDLDLLELEGVDRLALALLADDPGGHRLGQLARLGVDGGDLREIDGHGPETLWNRAALRGAGVPQSTRRTSSDGEHREPSRRGAIAADAVAPGTPCACRCGARASRSSGRRSP